MAARKRNLEKPTPPTHYLVTDNFDFYCNFMNHFKKGDLISASEINKFKEFKNKLMPVIAKVSNGDFGLKTEIIKELK